MTDDRDAGAGAARRDAELAGTVDDSTAGDEERRARATDPPPILGRDDRPEQRYTVEAEHARGGIGVILRARDARLDRAIAIKQLASTANPRWIRRFQRETLITARLQHPGIVPVYDAGQWADSAPYYSMKLVSGRTLRAELDARPTLDDRLALVPNVLAVAEAIGYAHAEGVIHRDLKPENIMIGAFGETVVLDWGLAKDLRAGELPAEPAGPPASADATRLGAVLGTPSYMAPEQARGEPVDERADVWAIGAILYHVLAAAPPFTGASSEQVVARVAREPAPPIAERAPGAPHDLIAIVEKAMARDPAGRYANAKPLAGDLTRFLTGQLVGARAYSWPALVRRWLRRHRAAAWVAAVLLTALAATLTVSIRRIVDERQVARARGDQLLLTQARSQLERDPTAALAWLKLYPEDAAGWDAVRTVIADAASRPIARHVWRGHPEYVGALAVAPGGGVVATGAGAICQLWDARTGRRLARLTVPPVARLAFSDDGSHLAIAGQDGSLIAIDVATGARRELGKAGGFITALLAVPHRPAVVTGDLTGAVQLWPLDGAPPRELTRHAGGVILAQVLDGGAAIATMGSADLELRRVPLDGGAPVALFPARVLAALPGALGALAVRGDAGSLVLGVDDRVLRWDLGAPAPIELGRHRAAIKAIAIAGDGRLASGADDGSVLLWTGAMASPRVGHDRAITALAFSGDGRLASGDTGGDVRVWTPAGGELLRGHDRRIESLVFGPDATLYSAGGDGSVRAWPARPAVPAIRVGALSAFRVAFVSPAAVAATDEDGTVHLIALPGGASREIARFTRQAYSIQRLSGGRFATASWDGGIAVFGPTGELVRRLDHGAEVNGLAASPDGTQLASTGNDGTVRIWNLATGESRLVERRTGAAFDAAFSPDGRALVTSGDDPALHVLDLVAGGAPRSLRGPTDVARALTFGRDGTLYSAGAEGVVRAWNLATGESRAYTGHEGRVRALALSADQRYLASGGADGNILVWDLAHGGRPTVLRGHAAEVRWVAFAPSGAVLASAGWDGTVRQWNLDDGSATVWRADDDKVQCVEFSPDGKTLASAGADGRVRLWTVDDRRAMPGPHPALVRWIDALTTAVIDDAPGSRTQAVTTPP
ncbi:MAG TPA: protein kinase [Kofleriaceae bacterium]|nr:protein kinase [Kofleriaceae bacterium]